METFSWDMRVYTLARTKGMNKITAGVAFRSLAKVMSIVKQREDALGTLSDDREEIRSSGRIWILFIRD